MTNLAKKKHATVIHFFGHPAPVFRFRLRVVKDGEGGVKVLGASTDTIKNGVKGMLGVSGFTIS